MEKEEQVNKVLNALGSVVTCPLCDTRIRYGDLECPHCGADLEDVLRQWAGMLVDHVSKGHP